MKKTETKRWRHTSPLAAIFYLGRIFKGITQNAVQSLAPLAAFLYAAEGSLMTRIVVGISLFLAVTIIASVVRYWFFRFRIGDDRIRIREGVFNKKQLDIKFDRIQAINTEQNFIYRRFGLVNVTFDTAGSAKEEGHLPAVPNELAESLQARIRREAPLRADTAEGADAEPPSSRRRLLTLGSSDIVRVGIADNRALVFLLLLGPLSEQIDERIGDVVNDRAEAYFESLQLGLLGGIALLAAIVFAVVAILVLASIVGAFLRYHRFVLVADEDVLRSTGGLLTRHEHSIRFNKIQSLLVRQDVMRRFMGRFEMRARQASSGSGGRRDFKIPLLAADLVATLKSEVFGDELPDADLDPRSAEFRALHPQYRRSRILLAGVLPALLAAATFAMPLGWFTLLLLLWIPIAVLFVTVLYRKSGYQVRPDGIVLRRGFFGYRMTAFLHRKVQRISLTQTVAQARRGVATLRFYLASGSVKLPYIDHALATRLRDYVLFRVESSRKAWH